MENIKFRHVLKSKKVIALVAATVVVLTLFSTKVYAESVVTRLSGSNRYETAAKICQDGWKETTEYAVIVNGENFPDALSAAPLAKKFDAPILLTGKDTLSPYTSVEISRLNVKNVFIIGGKGVVSQSIEDGLKARGIKVTRLGGANRYETALQVAAKVGKAKQIALVNGNDFHDGISISSIAALKEMPIILTDKDSMPSSVSKYLQSNKKAEQIYVVGGTDKISNSIVENLPNVKRIGSGDAYGINTGVIQAFQDEISTGTLYIASVKDFPDSLGASALAPKTSSPVLFVDSPMSEDTKRFLKSNMVSNLKILGGSGAVSYETEQIAKMLPASVSNTENITDTILQNQEYTPRSYVVVTGSDGKKREAHVTWNLTRIDATKPGIYTFNGKIDGTDKTVKTTLIVKPLPSKIDDIEATANSREQYELPKSVTGLMTDGSMSSVPVTWDYGNQDKNKPGVYVFYGTVDNYSKKVKLTLTIKVAPYIKTVRDVKRIFETKAEKDSYVPLNTIPVIMSNGSIKSVPVTWGPEMPPTVSSPGIYTREGIIEGYPGKVKLLLIVKSEGGVDPDPTDPGIPDPTDPVTNITMEVVQGDPIKLPKTALDPALNKQVPVVWNISEVDTSHTGSIIILGTLQGTNNVVKLIITVVPKILDIQNITVDVPKGQVYTPPTTVKAKISTGEIIDVPVIWDEPFVDTGNGNSQTYYMRGRVKHYSKDVRLIIKVIP